MRVLINECERWFHRPLCGIKHVHEVQCWDEDLQDALSDVRALQSRRDRDVALIKSLEDQLLDRQRREREREREQRGSDMRGMAPQAIWIDEIGNTQSTDFFVDYYQRAREERAEKQLTELVGDQIAMEGIDRVARVGQPLMYQTRDGKQFTTPQEAQKHAQLLRYRG